MIVQNFEQWDDEDIQRILGYQQVNEETYPPLLEWLDTEKNGEYSLSDNIKQLRILLKENVNDWNEDELKLMFIGPLLNEVNFNNYPHYKVFSQRRVEFKTDQIEAQGRVEWFVAQGKKKPRHPFFFLHEYKKELGGKNDPLGQLLIAMIYAQSHNEQEIPVYGTYVVGRLWFFVILGNKEYSVSNAFDATKEEDLKQILNIMQQAKKNIHQLLQID